MSPQSSELHIPDRFRLERRATCTQRTDEPVMLRGDDGQVWAVVESVPDIQAN